MGMPTQHWDKRWEEAHRKCEEAAAAGAPRALTDLGIAQVLLHTGQIHESKALVERVLQLQDTQDALEAERAEEFSRPDAEPRVYQLKISLRDARPPIWRRVLVDSSEPLGILHYTIQAAMGWEDDHLHHFTVNGGGPPAQNQRQGRELPGIRTTDSLSLGDHLRALAVSMPETVFDGFDIAQELGVRRCTLHSPPEVFPLKIHDVPLDSLPHSSVSRLHSLTSGECSQLVD
jgi:hypothetical protein